MASPALQTFIDASAGAAGSLFTCYLLYPLDLAKTQIQSGATKDVRSTLLRILRHVAPRPVDPRSVTPGPVCHALSSALPALRRVLSAPTSPQGRRPAGALRRAWAKGGARPMLTVRPGASVLYVRATRTSPLRSVRT